MTQGVDILSGVVEQLTECSGKAIFFLGFEKTEDMVKAEKSIFVGVGWWWLTPLSVRQTIIAARLQEATGDNKKHDNERRSIDEKPSVVSIGSVAEWQLHLGGTNWSDEG